MQLRIEFEQEADGRWIAKVPALPSVMTCGANRAEALAKVQALALRVLAERLEDGEAVPDPLTVSFQAAKEYQLGALLVHGIGRQPAGETLVRWGDVLVKTIDHATRHRVEVIAGPAHRDGPGDHEDRAESVVRLRARDRKLRARDREEQWLLSEGWWADAFLAPSYRELVLWSLRALPWCSALYIAQRYWQAGERDRAFAKVRRLAIAIAQLLIALALTPLFILFLTLALVLGLLPIPQLRTQILAAQGMLAATVGDSFAFVESPVRAALIRTRVLNGLERLKQRCERTIIIAHSQGAAVVLDALGAMEPAPEDGQAALRDPTARGVVPDTLVTFGAGTNQLASLKILSEGLPSKIGMNPTFPAIGALVVAAFLSALLYADIIWLHISPLQILQAAGLVLLVFAGFSLWSWVVSLLSKRWPVVQKKANHVNILTAILLILAINIWTELPVSRVLFLFIALLFLGLSIHTILSKQMEKVFTTVRKPPALRRWIDLYASADPVPNGPTRTRDNDGPDKSIPIWNLGSTVADHTAYWDNLDGFVLPVVSECAKTAESPWLAELPPATDSTDKRSEWRVRWLWLARWGVGLSWLLVGAYLWIWHGKDMPLLLEMPGWLPASLAETAARFVVLAALIALISWAILGMLRLLWRCWARAEQKAVLAHRKPADENARVWLFALFAFVYLHFILAFLVVGPMPFDVADLGTLIRELMRLLFVTCFALPLVSTMVLWRFKPPPEEPNSEAAVAGG